MIRLPYFTAMRGRARVIKLCLYAMMRRRDDEAADADAAIGPPPANTTRQHRVASLISRRNYAAYRQGLLRHDAHLMILAAGMIARARRCWPGK